MPPRRAASTKTAPKRDRSSSLSDYSEPESKPEPKKRAPPKAKAKATATTTAKPKAAKAAKFPPPGLDAASHPARSGLPAFQFTETKENGAIGPRDPSLPLFVGAHVSMAGGPATALLRASKAGANGLALFVKSQRKWASKDYEPEVIEQWKELAKSKDDGGGCKWMGVLKNADQHTRNGIQPRVDPRARRIPHQPLKQRRVGFIVACCS